MRGGLRALLLACLCSATQAQGSAPAPPQELFGELFVRVQETQLFPDGKTFADAVPKSPPQEILARYRAQAPADAPALRAFVLENFALPDADPAVAAPAQAAPLVAHIDALWPVLTRRTPVVPAFGSLLALPRPYVVPGGRFREIYYWDSYFTMLGLADSGRAREVRDMVEDFAHLISAYGHVPNGTRTYYLSRSQPPFFFAMVGLLDPAHPERAWARYLPQLRREYGFWMAGAEELKESSARRRVVRLPEGALLNRYYDDRDTPRDESYREDTELARASGRDPGGLYRDIRAAAESGWDFGTRWFEDPANRGSIVTTDIVPVDLNSLLFGLEQAIAAGCREKSDAACAQRFREAAAHRRDSLTRILWDPQGGTFLDYRLSRRELRPGVSAAMLYPLFVGAATGPEAHSVARVLEAQLLAPGGLLTTPVVSGQQWDAPNGWAPLQWIAVAGLRRYGEERLAAVIACRFLASVERVYAQSGKLVEKYDVSDPDRAGGGGEYPLQDGFGWTNGVTRRLLRLYPQFSQVQRASCPAPQARPAAP
ncbi:MAG: alpha,alpha-trehalase TreA [Proteobacteria bacterium]|nr:alpha,alpha-trehalase TreA [Pseudomonadota bacterium]